MAALEDGCIFMLSIMLSPKRKLELIPPWIDGEVLHSSRIKEAARVMAKASGLEKDWSEYKEINHYISNLTG